MKLKLSFETKLFLGILPFLICVGYFLLMQQQSDGSYRDTAEQSAKTTRVLQTAIKQDAGGKASQLSAELDRLTAGLKQADSRLPETIADSSIVRRLNALAIDNKVTLMEVTTESGEEQIAAFAYQLRKFNLVVRGDYDNLATYVSVLENERSPQELLLFPQFAMTHAQIDVKKGYSVAQVAFVIYARPVSKPEIASGAATGTAPALTASKVVFPTPG